MGRTTPSLSAGKGILTARLTPCKLILVLPKQSASSSLEAALEVSLGIPTYLKVDHFADRLRAAQAADADAEAAEAENEATAALPPSPGPRVVGRPVAGFFIDGPSVDPTLPTFAEQVKYGVAMFNATPPLYKMQDELCWGRVEMLDGTLCCTVRPRAGLRCAKSI